MNNANHEHAGELLKAAMIEEISADERSWLDSHLSSCHECAQVASALTESIQSLRFLPSTAAPELARQTKLAVRNRAEQLQAERTRSTWLWIAAAMSMTWMVMTAPYVWGTFAWLGRMVQIPAAAWQVGFLIWWFLPATVSAAAAAWRHSANEDRSNWLRVGNWRQL
jgi:anti-sigma factor RsiW